MHAIVLDLFYYNLKSHCLRLSSFFSFSIFNVRLLSVLRGHSVFSSPATTANDLRLRRIFYPSFYPLHLFSYLNSWERASIFPFECSVLNKSTTGTIFITSLVWRGPWLGIEPWNSRTRSQHYTTRISRRRFKFWHSGINNVTRVYCGLKVLLFSELRLTGAVMLHLTK